MNNFYYVFTIQFPDRPFHLKEQYHSFPFNFVTYATAANKLKDLHLNDFVFTCEWTGIFDYEVDKESEF